jgi:type VII secretion integral membrane protein EccD
LGLVVLVQAGPGPARAVGAGLVTLVLLAGAGLAVRAFGDRPAGLILAAAAVGYAAGCGVLIADGRGSAVAAAAAAASAAAVLAAAAVGDAAPALLATGATGAGTTVGGLLTVSGRFPPVSAAGIVLVLALLLSPQIPTLAFRLAGMRLPDLPTGPEDIKRDVTPVPPRQLATATARADRYVTALHIAVGLLGTGGLVLLARSPGWAAPALAATACTLLALRFRVLASRWQRLAVLAPAATGAALLGLRGVALLAPVPRLAAGLAGVLVLAFGLLAGARILPGRRPRPYWGRAAEIAETLAALGLLPLLLALLGVYGYVRGLGG